MRDHVSTDSLVAMTRALVAADTRNPPGNESLAVSVAKDLLTPLGFGFETIEPAPGRMSLIATLPCGVDRAPTLIINGHLDVVPINPAGWSVDPFGGTVSDGRVWGRGTADMKGGIAAAVEAVHTLDRARVARPCDLVFHLVADEERGGQLGTRVLADTGRIVGDACVVPEPTSLGLCIAERGLLTLDVALHGRPAHASEPTRGLSAIEKAAKVVLAVHGADFGRSHPLLGRPSANAGVIAGGSGSNTVAERCVVTIDHRTLPGQNLEDAVEDVQRLIDAIDDDELRYDLNTVVFGEASELAGDHPWIAMVQSAVRAVRGEDPPVLGMTFATDARFVRNDAGIPAIVCGPGGIAQAHVDDEWVAIEELVDAAAVYATLIAAFDAGAAAALKHQDVAARP